MKGALHLLSHSLRRVRSLVVGLGLVLGAFQVLLTLVAKSIQESEAFDQIAALIPDFVRQLLGPSFVGLMSFGGIVCVGYFHLAVMSTLTGLTIALATEPASEIETGFMDLVLARPLARHWVITRSVAAVMVCTAFLVSLMMVGTWSGLYLLAPAGAVWPSPRVITSLALNLWLLLLAWGAIALAIGSVCRRRSVAGSIAGVLALGTYLLDYMARAWQPAESVAWLSPFRYYTALDLILGADIPAVNVRVLLGIAVVGSALAYVMFSRRDI